MAEGKVEIEKRRKIKRDSDVLHVMNCSKKLPEKTKTKSTRSFAKSLRKQINKE